MAKLIDITGKALSGEWGTDDETGNGIPVLRTTNFTNDGMVNYKDVVTRNISKKNISDKFLRKGDIIIDTFIQRSNRNHIVTYDRWNYSI